jgi:putative membrane protein
MAVVASVLSILAGLVHIAIFLAETVWWRRPVVWRAFRLPDQAAADDTAFFAFNQGFYNLFLAVGALLGALFLLIGYSVAGWSLYLFSCTSMVIAALVLRMGGGPAYSRAALAQAAVPGLALLTAVPALA